MVLNSNARSMLLRNWFWPVAVLLVIGDLSSVYLGGWSDSQLVEAALLIDFVVVIPLLYWCCYRAKGKVAVIKALALACFAIWATGKALPDEHRSLLDSISWLRYLALTGLALLEIKLAVTVYKAVVFSGQSKEEAREKLESEGMPPWLAKFMAFEATLWRKVWLLAKSLFVSRTK